MEGEPEHVDLPKVGASNSIPVGLGVRDRWDGLVLGASAHGPSSLGDPDLLSANSSLCGGERVVEQPRSCTDRVRHAVLEVGVGVHADPVTGCRDLRVGAVGPRSPGVNVANGDFAQAGVGDGCPDLLNVVDEVGWVGSDAILCRDTRRGVAVQILAANRDTNDEICELGTIQLDGRLEGDKFSFNLAVASGGPDTKKESGILRDGGWDGLRSFVGRATTLLEAC